MTQSLGVANIFLEQARALASGGEVLPSVEQLAHRLQQAAETQKPLKVKLGLDPTRPDLHLGHSVVLRKLRAFQELGHEAVLIIGDATAMIGDPSGRNQTRPPLTEAEVAENAQTYLDQAGKIIDVRRARIVRNSEWFAGMHLGDFLKLAAHATVAQLLARDDFAKRYAEGRAIHMHELFYPLMQGYDSVMIDADIELGGTDQRFNNLMGREFQEAFGRDHAQLVLLMPLLEGTDGKVKMSKSYPEHCINLTDPPEEMFGKVMSIPDALIPRYELLLTPMSEEQVEQRREAMATPADMGGINPRDLKAGLAKWIIHQYHGLEASQQAEEQFVRRFRHGEIPEDMPGITLPADTAHALPALMAEHDLAPSRAEARRLIQGGGVRIDGEKVADPDHALAGPPGTEVVIQVGKRRFLKVRFS